MLVEIPRELRFQFHCLGTSVRAGLLPRLQATKFSENVYKIGKRTTFSGAKGMVGGHNAAGMNPRRKEFQNEQLKRSGESSTASALVSLQKPGADVLGQLLTGNTVVLECGLTAVETKLGWMVFGKGSCRIDNILPSLSMHSMSLPANNLSELEVLGIASEKEKEKDDFNLKDFNDKIIPDGRYEEELPWKLDSSNLPSIKCLARKKHEKMIN
ncbi:integrase catalytic domain-containing protein [Nephila pilipes]|uniref:Integrase catalytic domain-containing protein n=1 Tax=Nephila pilipes TaxID=299642 RepID=A0A8X6NB15_NEPPI|nr:integrase catalytic domain-containing protein [Nephila pilipes]